MNKEKRLTLRLNKWELEQLQKATEITGQSMSEFVRNAMLTKTQNIIEGEKNETKRIN